MYNEIDLHGTTKEVAVQLIQRFIVNCSKQGIHYIEIIHGYRNGSAIKEALMNHEIKSRLIEKIQAVPFNNGRTGIYIK